MTRSLRLSIAVLAVVVALGGQAVTAGPSRAASTGYIGIVGCSFTIQAATGYNLQTATTNRMWPQMDIGSGNLQAWAKKPDSSKWWTALDNALATYGADEIWFQICLQDTITGSKTLETLEGYTQTVYDRIRLRTSLPIVVSPSAAYTTDVCERVGPLETEWSVILADGIAATGQVLRGPDIGPLSVDYLNPDLCHINSSGKLLVGQQLADYFDS